MDKLSFKTATLQKHKHILAHQGTFAKAEAQTHCHVHEGLRLGVRQDQDYRISDHLGLIVRQ